ncbi:MAG: Holliday junction resolvase RuvX [Tenericutes bacterium HGW-Tenericutes-1]|jgi:putative Holliday junction resolvase|nr:MAG: Holliday junction resolvase RuvX [Tenericutes bacterium HGW-Tenericutes-1]
MKVLGLDLGTTTCGMAVSDPSEIIATGVETFRFEASNFELPLDYVKKFIDNNKIGLVVLGYPKNMDGSIGFQGQLVLDFKTKLEAMTEIKIVLWDERLTTRMVTQAMISGDMSRKKRKENVDRLAATVILQSYLDSRRR